MKRTFFLVTQMVLVLVAVGKLVGGLRWQRGVEVLDPLLPFLTARQSVVCAGLLEAGVAAYLTCRRSDGAKACGVLWLCAVLGAYRVGLWVTGFKGYCRCLGFWGSTLGLTERVASAVASYLLLFMLCGACSVLALRGVRARPAVEKARG